MGSTPGGIVRERYSVTIQQIRQLIQGDTYDFLRTNQHLGSRIMLLTLGGSYAYGTNVEGSDVDVRGVTLNSKQELLGLSHFEQVIDNQTDTTVYGFTKFVSLIAACNPNTIEMLGGDPDQYMMLSTAGRLLLDNKKLFLSRRAVHSFGGYAQAQLRRLQTSLAKERVQPMEKGRFILNTCNSAMYILEEDHDIPHGLVNLSLSDELDEYGEPVIVVKPNAAFAAFTKTGLPLRDFSVYLDELRGIIKSYNTMGHRNKMAQHKGDSKLNKHAMHLVRLYHMAFDILEKGEICTYRKDDHDELLAIRNGKYMLEDGTFLPEFFQMVSVLEERMKRDAAETDLPEKPDMKKIEELVIAVNEHAIRDERRVMRCEEPKLISAIVG